MSSSAWVKSAEKSEAEITAEELQAANEENGHVVKLRADANYPLLVDREQAIASEPFSVLRSRLLNLQAKSGMRSLIVTSAQKGEGKSLVCLNLAISLAQLERHRILLVDGDLRVKGISQLLRIRDE